MSPACRRPLNSLFEEDLQVRAESTDSNRLKNVEINGEVAERSIAADCKSAAQRATEVRTLPSPPTFQRRDAGDEGWASHGEGWWGRPPSCVLLVAAFRAAALVAERTRKSAVDDEGKGGRLALSERSESKGGSNSVVESQPSKLLVAGSIPVSRSSLRYAVAARKFRCREGGLRRHASATQTTAIDWFWMMDVVSEGPTCRLQREARRPM